MNVLMWKYIAAFLDAIVGLLTNNFFRELIQFLFHNWAALQLLVKTPTTAGNVINVMNVLMWRMWRM